MFGLIDHSALKDYLCTFIYNEGKGKKGGSNVASILHYYIINCIVSTRWSPGVIPKLSNTLIINLDNCYSQNKNNIVLRLANILVE